MVDILKKEIHLPFDEAVEHVKNRVAEGGFSVLLVKNIDEVIKTKLGIDEYPRYTIVLGCGPDLAKMALDVSKNVGLMFPCSFSVYEDEGKLYVAHVSIMKSAVELGLATADAMENVIRETSTRIHAVWEKI